MQYLLPSQSVNDVRFLLSSGAVELTLSTPGTLVDALTNTPSALVWS
jgi:hypothetical protein